MTTVMGMAGSCLAAIMPDVSAESLRSGPKYGTPWIGLCSQIRASDMGIVEQLSTGTRQGDAALLQHVRAVGELERSESVLLDQHHRDAASANIFDDLERGLDQRRRQPQRGLVE